MVLINTKYCESLVTVKIRVFQSTSFDNGPNLITLKKYIRGSEKLFDFSDCDNGSSLLLALVHSLLHLSPLASM